MTRHRTNQLGLLGLLLCGTLVVGCSPHVGEARRTVVPSAPNAIATTTPPVAPTVSAAPTATTPAADLNGDSVDCGGEPITLNGSTSSFVVVGDCPTVILGGSDNTIDATGAAVTSIEVNGDRNSIEAAEVSSIVISGQSNSALASAADSLSVNGNGNDTTVSGDLSAVSISGNNNIVVAGSDPFLDVSGSDNLVSRD